MIKIYEVVQQNSICEKNKLHVLAHITGLYALCPIMQKIADFGMHKIVHAHNSSMATFMHSVLGEMRTENVLI